MEQVPARKAKQQQQQQPEIRSSADEAAQA
jgi:hypothetical protein